MAFKFANIKKNTREAILIARDWANRMMADGRFYDQWKYWQRIPVDSFKFCLMGSFLRNILLKFVMEMVIGHGFST
jgi:hypothetical protein